MNSTFVQRILSLQQTAAMLPNPDEMHRMIGLVAFAFGRDTRANNGHYLEHADEVVTNTMSLFGTSPEQERQFAAIVACGHDLREDKAKLFGGLANLDRMLTEEFGKATVVEIDHLTNPEFPQEMTLEEKHELYRAHVIEVALRYRISKGVKLGDFMSNTGGIRRLYTSGQTDKALRLAKKYVPLIPHFKEVALDFAGSVDVIAQLEANENVALALLRGEPIS